MGIVHRREAWRLSARGWCVVVGCALTVAAATFFGIYPFLSVNCSVGSDVLVVEGWVHNYAIKRAAEAVQKGTYTSVFVTGGPVEGTGAFTSDYNTTAHVGASRLRAAGIDPTKVTSVPSRVNGRDRTYSSAIALRDFFAAQGRSVKEFTILTEAPHSRRSRLLFGKAFGDSVEIGTLPIPNPDYDSARWWRYSQGVRDMVGESIAYLYARLCFWPPKDDTGRPVAAL